MALGESVSGRRLGRLVVVEFFSLNDAVQKFYEQFWKHRLADKSAAGVVENGKRSDLEAQI